MNFVTSYHRIVIFILNTIFFVFANHAHHPIIFLAGYMGTQLKYQLNKADTGPYFCQKNLYYARSLWMDAYQAFSPMKKYCWLHFMSLEYDRKSRRSRAPEGVNVIVPPMGSTEAIEYIAPFPFHAKPAEYFINIINSLEKIGYLRGKDVFGAPYDWRKAPHEHQDFFEKLRFQVQEAYHKNGGKKVILFGHSMGGNFAYIFLRKQNIFWKQRFIRAVIFAGSPWGGNFKHMYDFMYEDDFPADLLPEFRQVERTYSSLAFLVPNKRIWGNDMFITSPGTEYTAENMPEYFTLAQNPTAISMWMDTKDLMDPFEHPEVDIYCVPGIGFNTLRSMILFNDNDITNRFTNFSQGDGFVNIESAAGCLKWFPNQNFNFYFKLLKASHLGMLREDESVQFFAKLIHDLP